MPTDALVGRPPLPSLEYYPAHVGTRTSNVPSIYRTLLPLALSCVCLTKPSPFWFPRDKLPVPSKNINIFLRISLSKVTAARFGPRLYFIAVSNHEGAKTDDGWRVMDDR